MAFADSATSVCAGMGKTQLRNRRIGVSDRQRRNRFAIRWSRIGALEFCFCRNFCDEPVATLPENALALPRDEDRA